MHGATVLILGCGDMGSAVAHWLFRSGARVLMCDRARPAHARRGMAFTDALFEGTATLEGITARFAETARAIDSAWQLNDAIPIATISEQEIRSAFSFNVAIDATMRRHLPQAQFRSWATSTIGLGPGFTPGENCHLAVETQWGESLGSVVRDRSTQARAGGPARLAGIGRERFVQSVQAGLWRTGAVIGQAVVANQEVGRIGEMPVRTPFAGTLRGLTHDSVEIDPGQIVVEVDPRDPPQVFGLGERPRAVARGVCNALGIDLAVDAIS